MSVRRRFNRRFQLSVATCLLGCLPVHAIIAARAVASDSALVEKDVKRGASQKQSPAAEARQDSTAKAARLATFKPPVGQSYFALSLKSSLKELDPPILADNSSQRKIVILFDTSASQTGIARTDGFASVRDMVDSLPADTQVALLACDVETIDLSGGLQSSSSPAINKALID